MRRRTSLSIAALAIAVLAVPAYAGALQEAPPLVRAATAVGPAPVALNLFQTQDAPPDGDPAAGQALGRRVSQALSAAGVTTVAAAVDVAGFDAVLRRDASHALPPASTQKNYTGLAALVALGPTARFRTEVAAVEQPVAGRLPGSVWLVGGGDPYLTMTGLRALAGGSAS